MTGHPIFDFILFLALAFGVFVLAAWALCDTDDEGPA